MSATDGKGGRIAAETAAAAAALAVGGGAYLASAPLWAAPLAAAVTWGLSRLVVVRAFPKRKPQSADDSWEASLVQLRSARGRILELSNQAKDPLVRQRGAAIVDELGKVILHIRQDPSDLITSQRFLTVYVERTKAILARYLQYEALETPQAAEVRAKVRDELLPALVDLCRQQLQRITYDDIRAFETDVDVLTKSIELEGL